MQTPPIVEETESPVEIQRTLSKLEGSFRQFTEDFTTKASQALTSGSQKVVSTAVSSALGPVSALMKPFESFFGFDFGKTISGLFDFQKKEKKGKGLFGTGEPYKGPLKKEDVKKIDPGSAYLGEIIQQSTGNGEEARERGGLGGILSSALGLSALSRLGGGGFISSLIKASPFLALAAGTVMAIFDGVKGWIQSEEFGVSKIAGFLGFFLSGTGEGWINAFRNAGKWALIGAGSGFLLGGPVGAIAGGLIGAAIGGVLGYFGGERTAQVIQKIGDFLMGFEFIENLVTYIKELSLSLFNFIASPFIGFFDNFMNVINLREIWSKSEESFGTRLGKSVANIFESLWSGIIGFFTGAALGLKELVLDIFVGKKNQEGERTERSLMKIFGDMILSLGRGIGDFFTSVFSNLFGSLRNLSVRAFDAGRLINSVIGDITGVIGGAFRRAGEMTIVASSWVEESIISPVSSWFGGVRRSISEFVQNAYRTSNNWVINNITSPVGEFFSRIATRIRDTWKNVNDWIDSKIMDPIRSVFSGILDFMSTIRLSIAETTSILDLGTRRADVVRGRERLERAGFSESGILEIAQTLADRENKTIAQALAQIAEMRDIRHLTVDDAIITKTGQVIETHPDDNIIASKNPISFATENEAIEDLKRMNQALHSSNGKSITDELKELAEVLKSTIGSSVAVQNNNFSSRFSPVNIMRNGTTEVI